MKNKYEGTEEKKEKMDGRKEEKKDNLKKCLQKKEQKAGKFVENNIQDGMNEGRGKTEKEEMQGIVEWKYKNGRKEYKRNSKKKEGNIDGKERGKKER